MKTSNSVSDIYYYLLEVWICSGYTYIFILKYRWWVLSLLKGQNHFVLGEKPIRKVSFLRDSVIFF